MAKKSDPDDELRRFVKTNNVKAVTAAFAAGASVYAVDDDAEPLVVAAIDAGRVAIVKAFLAAGLDVQVRASSIGWSYLMVAALVNSAAMIRLLIEHGANVNHRSRGNGVDGETALTNACGSNMDEAQPKSVLALLEAGADPDLPRTDGWTPLMLVAYLGNRKLVEALLDAGASPQLGRGNVTPAAVAREHGHDEIARLLDAHASDDPIAAFTKRLRASLKVIARWLAANAKPHLAAVENAQPPTTEDLAKLEAAVGRALPPQLRAFVALVGGSEGIRLLHLTILSATAIADQWICVEVTRERQWVPFATDRDGNLRCVDRDGKVIAWDAKATTFTEQAQSFEAYLAMLRDELACGRFRYDAATDAFVELRPRGADVLDPGDRQLERLKPDMQRMLSAARAIGVSQKVMDKFSAIPQGADLPKLTPARKRQIAAIEDRNWQLAAAWPLTNAELADAERTHRAPTDTSAYLWERIEHVRYSFACRLYGSTDHANLSRRDLRGLSFAGRALAGAQLNLTLADKVDFSGAVLEHALLTNIRAPGARFDRAKLRGADFSQSDLRKATFRNADLRDADLQDCDLTGCDFTGAQIEGIKNVRKKHVSLLAGPPAKRRAGNKSARARAPARSSQ